MGQAASTCVTSPRSEGRRRREEFIHLLDIPADAFGPIFSFMPTALEQARLRGACTLTVDAFNLAVLNEHFIALAGTTATNGYATWEQTPFAQRLAVRWFPLRLMATGSPKRASTAVGPAIFDPSVGNVDATAATVSCIVVGTLWQEAFDDPSSHDNAAWYRLPRSDIVLVLEEPFNHGLGTEQEFRVRRYSERGTIARRSFVLKWYLRCLDLSRCRKLQTIGESSFEAALSLRDVRFPSSVTEISKAAFVASGITELDFAHCSELFTIGERAFAGMQGLKTLRLPASVINIDPLAFMSCGLTQLDLSHCTRMTCIRAGAFAEFSALKTLKLPSFLTFIGPDAFYRCGVELVDLSHCDALRSVGDRAFSFAASLRTLRLPACITSIEPNAFDNTPIRQLDLAHCMQLDTIGACAFAGATSLSEVRLPSTITSIAPSAFDRTAVSQLDLSHCTKTLPAMADRALANARPTVVRDVRMRLPHLRYAAS